MLLVKLTAHINQTSFDNQENITLLHTVLVCAGVNKLIIKKVPASGGSEKLLTVGTDKVTPDQRISITGSRLTISHTRPRDAGTFLCHFDLEPPVQLRHQLDVQYAPTVRALVPPEQHVARGKTITLECQAHGNPEPIIRWSRQGGALPSGRHTSQVSRACQY